MNDLIIQSQNLPEQVNNICNQNNFTPVQFDISKITSSYTKAMTSTLLKINNLYIHNITDIYREVYRSINTDLLNNLAATISRVRESIAEMTTACIKNISKSLEIWVSEWEKHHEVFNRILFLKIIDEIGFPMYLEINTELQDRLLESYRMNNNCCNIKEMQQIIIEYCNDEYLEKIIQGVTNTSVFSSQRKALLLEGISVYQIGYYASSGALFAAQMSGMIRDIYDSLKTVHKFTYKERVKIKEYFDLQRCRDDSEKTMLAEILYVQEDELILLFKAVDYFIKTIYSSGSRCMEEQPKRHLILHGIQTNFNTKEMNLKQIICIDILTELAWQIERMKENSTIIEVEQLYE